MIDKWMKALAIISFVGLLTVLYSDYQVSLMIGCSFFTRLSMTYIAMQFLVHY
jgi:hypothetical protein